MPLRFRETIPLPREAGVSRLRAVGSPTARLPKALRLAGLALAMALPAPGLHAAAEKLSKDEIRSALITPDVTIPTPGEFFAAIDKTGQPNWKQMFAPKPAEATASRDQMALMLGLLVADGYIAVEAQDGQGVKNVGKDIINLAKKLNVSQSVLGRGNSISDFAENNDWSALREELEATQNEVKLSMVEQKDNDLVILVSIGAWIRGTQVASAFVEKAYTPELAGLLRQPAIVEYLLGEVDRLPEKLRVEPLIIELRTKLAAILPLVETPKRAPLTPEAVAQLSATMSSLVGAITAGSKDL